MHVQRIDTCSTGNPFLGTIKSSGLIVPVRTHHPARRWRRIDLVRKLATQAAMEGTEGFNAHFVRVQRLNVSEKQGAARRIAGSILQKQLEAIRQDRDWGPAPEGGWRGGGGDKPGGLWVAGGGW